MEHNDIIRQNIIRDMSEGALLLGLDGKIQMANPAALDILCMQESDLTGRPFAACFFEYPENDEFNQLVLDAVYDRESRHEGIVPYMCEGGLKTLKVNTSFLQSGGEKVGIIAVLSDISELAELRDAVKAMNRIQALNKQLEIRNRLLKETFGRYLSDDIVKTILETPDGLTMGGVRRELTVMMSDLRGFTSMCERMDPEDVIELLNHYFAIMYEEIDKQQGTLLEFMGDGILVVFGAPIASDRHAEQAVAAAIGMQSRMDEVNAWNREHGFSELAMGIGISSGNVIVGNIGSEKRTKYGVMGSVVNLAARIQACTLKGQILLSPASLSSIRCPVRTDGSILRELKGFSEPVELTFVSGIGPDCAE